MTTGLADVIENILSLPGNRKDYLTRTVQRDRFFDVKGLTAQGDYYLELDRVYVELDLTEKESETESLERSVWDFLFPHTESGKRLVLIGSPGSGKTTLLKHLSLILSKHGSYRGYKKLPILFLIREHAAAICENTNLLLSDVVAIQVQGLNVKTPPQWFQNQLDRGTCIVLMDGLDEIADNDKRLTIVEWVQKQLNNFPKSDFIVTSRPHGYDNNPLVDVQVLRIKPFSQSKRDSFITNWYLANELKKSQVDDDGVRREAKKGAEDLIRRIQLRPDLAQLAVNPLLLTMIATVHSFKEVLPGRRVELYRDIFDVFLERRRKVIWLDDPLSTPQKLQVLKVLAYFMMTNRLRTIPEQDALKVIQSELLSVVDKMVSAKLSADGFLERIKNQSGLLLEAEKDEYAFAHLTFQEFLAASYILDDKTRELEKKLISSVDDGWWAETTRLYAAQTDATPVLEACLKNTPPKITSLSLAIDCLVEALKIQPIVRDKLQRVIDIEAESIDPQRRALIAEASLFSRLRWMNPIDEDTLVDPSLIKNIEYQLFIDEKRGEKQYYYPDHWVTDKFPEGHSFMPVLGIRVSDAVEFCKWLTSRDIWQARYRLLYESEAPSVLEEDALYWIMLNDNSFALAPLVKRREEGEVEHSPRHITQIRRDKIVQVLEGDLDRLERLRKASLERSKTQPKIDELLKSPYIPQSVGYGEKKLGASVRDYDFEKRSLQNFQDQIMLKQFELFSVELDLELLPILDLSFFMFLENKENKVKYTNWILTITAQKYFFSTELDLSQRCAAMLRALDDIEKQINIENFLKTIFSQMRRSLNLLIKREWNMFPFSREENSRDYLSDRANCYDYVRWFSRVVVVNLISLLLSSSRLSFATTQKFIQVAMNLLVDMMFLEERINGLQNPYEGLRIVKTVKRLGSGSE